MLSPLVYMKLVTRLEGVFYVGLMVDVIQFVGNIERTKLKTTNDHHPTYGRMSTRVTYIMYYYTYDLTQLSLFSEGWVSYSQSQSTIVSKFLS